MAVLRGGMFRPSFQAFCVVIACYSLLCVQSVNFADDPGVGWHLRTGQLISKTWQPPQHDPFLYSSTPRVWVSDQWLSDLLFYYLYRIGSWPLLYATIFCLYMAVFFVILYPAIVRAGGSYLCASFATLVAFKLSQIHFILRPVIFSFLGFALVYVVLLRMECRDLKSKEDGASGLYFSSKHYVLLPLVFLIWSNLHPAFVLGLLLLLFYFASFFVKALFCRHEKLSTIKTPIISYCLMAALCFAVTLINPYGIRLHQSIIQLGSSDYFMRLNTEWLPISLSEYSGKLFVGALAVIFIGVFLGRFIICNVPFQLLVTGIFAIKSWYVARFLPFFGIVSAPTLARSWRAIGESQLLNKIPGFSRIVFGFRRLEKIESRSGRARLILPLVMIGVVVSAIIREDLLLYSGPFGPRLAKYPYNAVEFILNQTGTDLVVSATPNWGGFLTWWGSGRIKPVIDDRNTLLGEGAYKDFFAAMKTDGPWEDYIEANRVNFLLVQGVRKKFIEALKKSDLLEMVYKDEIAVLFKVVKYN